jgi:hypothetical protein
MAEKSNKTVSFFLALFITVVLIMPFISSCGKGGAASSVGLNTQLQILNLGPDMGAVTLYVNYIRQNITTTYTYPNASGYFYLNTTAPPLQIKSANVNTSTTVFVTLDSTFKANHKYSLFITGLYSSNSIASIFTEDDTAATPIQGYGKVRFVNASLPATAQLNVLVNGTLSPSFTGLKFKAVTDYLELPAGNYNFQLTQTSVPTVLLPNTGVQNVTIQDGRLYTLYSYGIVGRPTTDTATFGAALLTNR